MTDITTQTIIDIMTEAKLEQTEAIKKLKRDVKTGDSDPENYDSLRGYISERYMAKMEVLENIGKIIHNK